MNKQIPFNFDPVNEPARCQTGLGAKALISFDSSLPANKDSIQAALRAALAPGFDVHVYVADDALEALIFHEGGLSHAVDSDAVSRANEAELARVIDAARKESPSKKSLRVLYTLAVSVGGTDQYSIGTMSFVDAAGVSHSVSGRPKPIKGIDLTGDSIQGALQSVDLTRAEITVKVGKKRVVASMERRDADDELVAELFSLLFAYLNFEITVPATISNEGGIGILMNDLFSALKKRDSLGRS